MVNWRAADVIDDAVAVSSTPQYLRKQSHEQL
jgi:hypothetical protein